MRTVLNILNFVLGGFATTLSWFLATLVNPSTTPKIAAISSECISLINKPLSRKIYSAK